MTTTKIIIMNETSKKDEMKQQHHHQLSSTTKISSSGSSNPTTKNNNNNFEDKKPENFRKKSSSSKMVVLADSSSSSVIYHPSLINKIKKRTLFFIFIPAIPVILIFLFFLLLIDQKVLFDSSNPPQPQQSSTPPSTPIQQKLPPMIHRLPHTLIPSLYILTLQVFLPYKPGVDFGPLNQTVVGSVIINFECRQDTDIILLNANDLLIKNDSLKLGDQDSNKSLNVEVESFNNETNILKLRSHPPLAKGRNYTLLIHYGTRVRSPLHGGLFLASYEHNGEKRYHVVSQMQPIESRKVFPCFDEPSFKARFQINIIHPTGTTAISNTEAVDRLEHKTNWTRTEFEISPIMSTYLLAIAITDFGYIETTYRDIKLRVWAQPKLLNDTQVALNLLPKGLHFYEDYFNISYPLSKLDYYAVQELRVAAMENWGMITIQESSVVHNPQRGSLNSFSNVAMTVLHELAHMWFGNLITMRWWNDLWLNEGFACHMSYKAMRKVTPEVDVNFMFQYATFVVQNSEEKQKLSPLSSNVTFVPDIFSAFNKINYNKGSAVINMFESIVGEDVFRLSLQSFIKHHFYDNAISADFARSIGRTMKYLNSSNPFGHLGVAGALKTWTKKPGFPQITVTRINETAVEISQQPCYTADIFKNTSHFRYSVPIAYTTTKNDSTALSIINNNETLIVNDLALIDPYATCYCRILYDDQTWLRIAQQLRQNHTVIATASRARLIFESNSFASLEKLNITISFELAKYLKNEIEPGPIQTFLLHMDSYQYIFYGNETKPLLRKYISSLLIPIFERVISEEGQKIDEQVKRLIILKLCLLQYEPCINYVQNIFSQVIKDCKHSLLSNPSCNKIEAGYRSSIYAIAVKFGNKEVFEFVWEKYLAETEMGEKEYLLQGIAATEDYDLAKRVIKYHIENSTHSSQFCVMYYTASTLKQLRPYLMNNIEYLVKHAKGTKFLSVCMHAIYRFPQKENLVQEIKEFEAAHKDLIKRAGAFVVGTIGGRKRGNAQDYKMKKFYAQTVNSYLTEYVSSLSD